MFGPKLRNVFRSRWNALFWASGVLLTAYCSVPAENEPGDADAIAVLVSVTQKHDAKPAHAANPWAKEAN